MILETLRLRVIINHRFHKFLQKGNEEIDANTKDDKNKKTTALTAGIKAEDHHDKTKEARAPLFTFSLFFFSSFGETPYLL